MTTKSRDLLTQNGAKRRKPGDDDAGLKPPSFSIAGHDFGVM
jgi:hypothetical protein